MSSLCGVALSVLPLNELPEVPAEFAVDETFYLDKYSDVAAAVVAGAVLSASEHFKKHGIFEGRIPNPNVGDQFLRWLRETRVIEQKCHEESGVKSKVRHLASLAGIEFFQFLEAQMYYRSRHLKEDREEFLKELMALSSTLADRERVLVCNWFMANHDHNEVKQVLPLVESIKDGTILPSLAKAIDEYYLDTGMCGDVREIMIEKFFGSDEYSRFQLGDTRVFADDLVRAHASELDARYNAKSTFALPRTKAAGANEASKRHVFVGFFGQLRFPHDTLPQLCEQIRSEFSGTQISFGVSTWDKQGARALADYDPVNFACEQLPIDFEDFCLSNGVCSVGELARVFPALTDFLRLRGEASKSVSEELIGQLCGTDTYCSIDADDVYLATVGAAIDKEFPSKGYMLNQGRMWNRIGKFRELLDNAEWQYGTVTDVIFLRSDLKVSGDLAAAVQPVLGAGPSDRRVLVDYDAHAKNLTGVGDRIFVAKRDSAFRLIDGENVMQATLREGGLVKEIYYWFMTMHTYAQTLIYQHGCEPTSIDSSKFAVEIYRGRLGWRQILEPGALDAVYSPHPAAREFLVRCHGL